MALSEVCTLFSPVNLKGQGQKICHTLLSPMEQIVNMGYTNNI